MIDGVLAALKQEDEIVLVGFGRFYKVKLKARKERNPKTGKEIMIPAYVQVKFLEGKNLKESCNSI